MSQQTDILVVGAGVVGLAIARALSLAGIDVTIIDQFDYGTAASGVNLGQISVGDREPGLEYALVMETLETYQKVTDSKKLDYTRTGGLAVLDSEEDIRNAETIYRKKREAGFRMEMLYGDEVKRQEPHLEHVAGAVLSLDEGGVNPFRVTTWLLDEAAERGARFIRNCPVTGFLRRDHRILGVETGHGEIRAGTTVLATGSWTRELCKSLNLEVPVDYVRGTAMVTQPMPKMMNGPVVNSFFTHSVDAGATVLFGGLQEATGGILISQANRPGRNFDTGVDYQDIALMARLFLSHYPVMRDVQLLRTWSGLTTVSRDGLPLWGFSSIYQGLFFAVAMKGAFSLAAAAGRWSAEMVLGRGAPEGAGEWCPGRVEI